MTEDRQARDGWSADDVAELGAAVKAAVDAGEEDDVRAWGVYLAVEASIVREFARACRKAEARIKAERAAQRDRKVREVT